MPAQIPSNSTFCSHINLLLEKTMLLARLHVASLQDASDGAGPTCHGLIPKPPTHVGLNSSQV